MVGVYADPFCCDPAAVQLYVYKIKHLECHYPDVCRTVFMCGTSVSDWGLGAVAT